MLYLNLGFIVIVLGFSVYGLLKLMDFIGDALLDISDLNKRGTSRAQIAFTRYLELKGRLAAAETQIQESIKVQNAHKSILKKLVTNSQISYPKAKQTKKVSGKK